MEVKKPVAATVPVAGYLIQWARGSQMYRGPQTISAVPCHEDDGTNHPLMRISDLPKWKCYVAKLKASNGVTWVVCIDHPSKVGMLDGTMEANHYPEGERYQAEYECAEWNHFLNGGEEPDILNYGPEMTFND
jgi:hypothetical protein